MAGAQAQTGAVPLIQRFGSATNRTNHLHGLMLPGVYRLTNVVFEKHLVARTPDTLIEETSNL